MRLLFNARLSVAAWLLCATALLVGCSSSPSPAAGGPPAPTTPPAVAPTRAASPVAAASSSAAASPTSSAAAAASQPAPQALLDAAARESGVVWYESLTQAQGDEIIAQFARTYPQIKNPQYVEVTSAQLPARILQESQGGGPTADYSALDVPLLSSYKALDFVRELDFAALDIPPSPDVTPTNFAVAIAAPIYGVLYNTNLVQASEVPRNFEDLVNPRWKGRTGTWVRPAGWMALDQDVGTNAVRDLVTRFAQLQPRVFDSTFTAAQAVGSGEIALAFTIYHTALPTIRQGAPVKWQNLDPVPTSPIYGFVSTKGKNPASGQLLLRWLATRDGNAVYERVSGRGSPYIASSETAKLLAGNRLAVIPADVQVRDADRLNKLADDLTRILQGR